MSHKLSATIVIKNRKDLEVVGITILLKHATISAEAGGLSKEEFYQLVDIAWGNISCDGNDCGICLNDKQNI